MLPLMGLILPQDGVRCIAFQEFEIESLVGQWDKNLSEDINAMGFF